MNAKKVASFELEVFSPVHIGSGRGPLQLEADFVHEDGVHVIDTERLFSAYYDSGAAWHPASAGLSSLLQGKSAKKYARYSLGVPGANGEIKQFLECVKDAWCNPYIPGSSLKGAIRLAVARAILVSEKVPVEVRDLGYNPRFAAAPLLARVFGASPNTDLLRLLHVADSDAVPHEDALELCHVVLHTLRGVPKSRHLTPKGAGYEFHLECLRPGTILPGVVRKDGFLLEPGPARHLGFGKRAVDVLDFPRHCNALARALIEVEKSFFDTHRLPRIVTFYEGLERRLGTLDESRECLIQMSWGTGWRAKTLGTIFGDELLGKIRTQYRLGRTGDILFPKTRRLVQRREEAAEPMGWVRLSLTESLK